METTNFLTWFGVIGLVAGFSLGVMVWAYVGTGSISVLFETPLPLPPGLDPTGQDSAITERFQQGVEAFQSRKYRQAKQCFTQVVEQQDWAEAYHNLGLVCANLYEDFEALTYLRQAGFSYAQREDEGGIALIKDHLEAIKARKLAKEQKG